MPAGNARQNRKVPKPPHINFRHPFLPTAKAVWSTLSLATKVLDRQHTSLFPRSDNIRPAVRHGCQARENSTERETLLSMPALSPRVSRENLCFPRRPSLLRGIRATKFQLWLFLRSAGGIGLAAHPYDSDFCNGASGSGWDGVPMRAGG